MVIAIIIVEVRCNPIFVRVNTLLKVASAFLLLSGTVYFSFLNAMVFHQ